MLTFHKILTTTAISLANDTQIEVDQLWQEYAEPSMQDEFLTETEAESRKSSPSRQPELTEAVFLKDEMRIERLRGWISR